MKLFTRQYVLLPLILAATGSLAQTQQVKFNLVTGTNGVSLGKINGMTRDKFGFMWFSGETNRCIIRFDGSHMTRYMNDPRNPNSLGGYYPECLSADEEGNIWVGFYGQGVDKFDQITNTFSHYRHKKDDPESLGSDTVSAILVDHLGNVWVGNDSGLDLLDKNTGKFKHFRNKAGDPSSLSHNMVRSLYEDRNGELWVGTGFAFSPQEKGGGLNRFNRSSGTFTRYLHDPKNPHSLIDNKVRSIFEDSYGTLWIGTNGDGLHTMDKKTGVITRHRYNPSKPDELSRPPVKREIDHITFITEDADRKIWIGTLLNGLTRFDPSSNKIDRFANDTDKTGALNDNSCWWANSTPDGFVWMSTQNSNLFKIDIYHSVIPHVGDKRADGLRAFAEGSDSICWYGTLEGLIRKNLKTGSTRKFVHELANENSLSNDHVRCIMPDKNGDLWIGTDDGFNHFNFKTETFTRYYHNPSASLNLFNGVTSLYQDHDSSIWAGSVGSGLAKLDPRTGKLIIFNGADSNSISRHSITALQGGNKNDLWIGTYNQGGLNKLSMENGKVTYYLPGSNIYSLFRDAAGIFWVGTDEALFRYDEKTDSFNSIAETNSGNNIVEVSSIVSDDEDNLWVGTRTSIYRLNKARDQVTRYGNEYGIPDANNFFYVSFKRHDGQLIFGDDFGYYTFYPKELKRTSSKTQLYFTRFWLNDKEVIPTKKGPLKESLFFEKKIDLLYNQNVFSFSSTFVDFRNDGEKKIYYKLENYDADWHSAEAEQQVQYFKVPAGNYMLRIKTANTSDGEWVNRSMAITISPPWWATWWAYIVYSLLFIAAVYSVHRLQRSRVIRAERERTRARELEQAKEIEKAYRTLKQTQSQLIQAEKMASLGELTAGIAHEIQNPLNFVNNFSEVNSELIAELKQEIDKGNLAEVQAIAGAIDENEKKIIFHGKRADAIVKGMLQHSRSSSGVKEPTDINALADEYLRLAYHGLRAKDKTFNASMETDFDQRIGKINIIPQDLGRVILNLITNAFYEVDEKKKSGLEHYEPTVSVSTKIINDKVEIRVKDNGNGIPQKIVDKIFQPFFTTKPTGQGTGLGLSLSYDIVQAHGGELKVESKEGQGATFIIQLPV